MQVATNETTDVTENRNEQNHRFASKLRKFEKWTWGLENRRLLNRRKIENKKLTQEQDDKSHVEAFKVRFSQLQCIQIVLTLHTVKIV